MNRKARKATLKQAQAAAAAGQHEQARALFAACGISYVPATSTTTH